MKHNQIKLGTLWDMRSLSSDGCCPIALPHTTVNGKSIVVCGSAWVLPRHATIIKLRNRMLQLSWNLFAKRSK